MSTLNTLDIMRVVDQLRLDAARKSAATEADPLEHIAAVAFENGVLTTVNTILGALRQKRSVP